jgi:hypothetical protein
VEVLRRLKFFILILGVVANRKSCGSEICKSLSRGKVQNNLLHNVFKEAKYLS